ncbi:MAG: hypothetical protein QM831_28335 [Kofleriaceae bacterium]
MRVALVVAALIAVAHPAHAGDDDPPFVIGSTPSWSMLAGLTTGGSFGVGDNGGNGALVGGEVSLAVLRDKEFAGIYGDAFYDWGAGAPTITAGPELGYFLTGLDGGIALRFGDKTDVGLAARLTVGLGAVGVYVRYMHFFDVMEEENVVQAGLVLKLPVWTRGGTR